MVENFDGPDRHQESGCGRHTAPPRPRTMARREPVRMPGIKEDVLLNGIDFDQDIRPDLLEAIRGKLRSSLAKVNTKIRSSADARHGDLRIGIGGVDVLGPMDQTSRRLVAIAVLRELEASHPSLLYSILNRPRVTPWQRFTRFIARMIGPRTRRS